MARLTQKALILPAKRANFVVGSAIIPRPHPSEVLVRIESAALNPVEWKIREYGVFVETYPAILGTDAAGIVEEVGSEVITLTKGDRIFWQGFFQPQHGTYQQYALVPAELAAKAINVEDDQMPSTFSFDQAATLPVAICSAVLGMYNRNPLSQSAHFVPPWEEGGLTTYVGKPALIMGGSSSVGQAAIQMAKLSGFSPIITTASPSNAPLLIALGATHTLDRFLPQSELLSKVRDITCGAPLTFAYDAISSSETQPTAYKALAPGGTLIITWRSAIPTAEDPVDESKRVVELYASVYVPQNREVGVALFKRLEGWLESKVLQPNDVEILSGGLAAIPAGLECIKAGTVNAKKLVVHPHATD